MNDTEQTHPVAVIQANNPLRRLVVNIIGPCNCKPGAFVARDYQGKFHCIPPRLHFNSNTKSKKHKVFVGLTNDLRANVARISEQESNLAVMANAILQIDNTIKVKYNE